MARLALIAALALALPSPSPAHQVPVDHRLAVDRVAGMVADREAQSLASRHGLRILNVLWEDTGRWQGSSLGPSISDVTIEVVSEDRSGRRLALMPVLRFPNFADRTADVSLDRIFLRVGNERSGEPGRVISLRDFLAEPLRYLSLPWSGTIRGGTLLAPRDTHALVSAQAAFLPVPRHGKATFHPVIFNYQSTANDPAVLTILVTRQGSSLTVVDNSRDTVGAGSWGQRLFFNAGGERAPLTAERLSDVKAHGTTGNGESAASLGEDANLLLLVQVPLRRREPPRRLAPSEAKAAPPPAAAGAMAESRASDMEVAVLGHGELQGPYTELAGLSVERDPRFPVRVTVQFYQATSTGRVGAGEMAGLASLVEKVYSRGDWVGSLVIPSRAEARRPTSWEGVSPPPPHVSWQDFPGLVERWKGRGGVIGVR